jgi:RNA recognition motif-containing protein
MSRGFGFVTFKTKEGAKEALKQDHSIRSKRFECKAILNDKQAKKESKQLQEKKVFVGSLNRSIQEKDLLEYFSKFGVIKRVIINRTHGTNEHRGSGFVIFEDKQIAEEVI